MDKSINVAGTSLFALKNNWDGIQNKEVTIKILTIKEEISMGVSRSDAQYINPSSLANFPVSGKKAGGGAVMGGAGSYLVGELGPELFNPAGTGGSIVPNNRLTGGGGLAIGTLNVYGVQSTSELFNQLSKEARARGMQFAVN